MRMISPLIESSEQIGDRLIMDCRVLGVRARSRMRRRRATSQIVDDYEQQIEIHLFGATLETRHKLLEQR